MWTTQNKTVTYPTQNYFQNVRTVQFFETATCKD
jgi:hypothetical protein